MSFRPAPMYFEIENMLMPFHKASECVYFAEDKNTGDFVKIGRSADPWRRAKGLNARIVVVFGCRTGRGPEVERYMHKRYAEFRTTGEWFHARPVFEDLRWAVSGEANSGDPSDRVFCHDYATVLVLLDKTRCDLPYGRVVCRDDVGDPELEFDSNGPILHPDRLEYCW